MSITTSPNTVSHIEYWANRFGEPCEPKEPKGPLITPDQCDRIIEFYPENTSQFCECGHVATVNGEPGLVIEWEYYDDQDDLESSYIHAWRKAAPEGCIFDAYPGDEARPTFNGRWVMIAFVPAERLSPDFVSHVCEVFAAHL